MRIIVILSCLVLTVSMPAYAQRQDNGISIIKVGPIVVGIGTDRQTGLLVQFLTNTNLADKSSLCALGRRAWEQEWRGKTEQLHYAFGILQAQNQISDGHFVDMYMMQFLRDKSGYWRMQGECARYDLEE